MVRHISQEQFVCPEPLKTGRTSIEIGLKMVRLVGSCSGTTFAGTAGIQIINSLITACILYQCNPFIISFHLTYKELSKCSTNIESFIFKYNATIDSKHHEYCNKCSAICVVAFLGAVCLKLSVPLTLFRRVGVLLYDKSYMCLSNRTIGISDNFATALPDAILHLPTSMRRSISNRLDSGDAVLVLPCLN